MSAIQKALIVGLGLCASTIVWGAAAVDMKTVIETRQHNYKSLGKAFKSINDDLKQDAPDLAVLKDNAETMNKLALQIPDWFPAGSGPEAGIKTRAKAEIWTNNAEFTDLAHKLQAEVSKLSQIAAAGDVAGERMQVQPVGQACKACHDKFRAPEEP